MQSALKLLTILLPMIYVAAALTTAAHALLNKRDSRSAWGWIALCWLFPLGGAALYWVLGVNRVEGYVQRLSERARKMVVSDSPAADVATSPSRRELVRAGEQASGAALLAGNAVEPLYNGEQAYPAMLDAIANARESVYLTSYIFRADTIGHRFARALADALQRGVRVRVLLDGVSDLYYRPRASRMLRDIGVPYALFLPLTLWPPLLHANLRNHRKLLLVDGNIAFTGGMNIADYHLLNGSTREPVADLQFRVRGPLLNQLEAVFRADWFFSSEEVLPASAPTTGIGNAACRVITDGPNDDRGPYMLLLMAALASAHRSVCVMTPYFLPPAPIAAALAATAMRGITVRVLLPEESDQPWVDWAARHALLPLLQRKVQIYFGAAPFAHTKLLLIDDEYVQFGSANLDARSMRLNFELNVEAYDRDLAAELLRHFDAEITRARQLDLRTQKRRHLPQRLRNAFFWLFSPFL